MGIEAKGDGITVISKVMKSGRVAQLLIWQGGGQHQRYDAYPMKLPVYATHRQSVRKRRVVDQYLPDLTLADCRESGARLPEKLNR